MAGEKPKEIKKKKEVNYGEMFKFDVFDKAFKSKDRNLYQPKAIRREEWEAMQPEGTMAPLKRPVSNVIITYTNSKPCTDRTECIVTVRLFQRYFMKKGCFDIPYSFLITPDGAIFECRGWSEAPLTPPGERDFMDNTLVIAHLGFKPGPLKTGKDAVKKATEKIIDYGIVHAYIKRKHKLLKMDPWTSIQ